MKPQASCAHPELTHHFWTGEHKGKGVFGKTSSLIYFVITPATILSPVVQDVFSIQVELGFQAFLHLTA